MKLSAKHTFVETGKVRKVRGWNSLKKRFQKFSFALQYVHLLVAQVILYFFCNVLQYVRQCLALHLLVAQVVPETDVFAVDIRHATPYGRQLWIGFFAP